MERRIEILKDVLGHYGRSNDEYLFKCPQCNHHKRKFSINLDKNVFKCWVCDWSGRDIYRIVRRYADYESKYYWWEFIIILRLVCLATIGVIYEGNPHMESALGLQVLFISIVLFLIFTTKKKNLKNQNFNFNLFYYCLIFLILLEWFYNHPSLRYGGYIIFGLVFFYSIVSFVIRISNIKVF